MVRRSMLKSVMRVISPDFPCCALTALLPFTHSCRQYTILLPCIGASATQTFSLSCSGRRLSVHPLRHPPSVMPPLITVGVAPLSPMMMVGESSVPESSGLTNRGFASLYTPPCRWIVMPPTMSFLCSLRHSRAIFRAAWGVRSGCDCVPSALSLPPAATYMSPAVAGIAVAMMRAMSDIISFFIFSLFV